MRTTFSKTIISSMHNTVARKKICMFGFAFKKDTGDTRETASMYVGRDLLEERALLSIYDPEDRLGFAFCSTDYRSTIQT